MRPGQAAKDRPDLATRVFELKRKCLLDDIFKRKVFGKASGRVWTVEYQKRGLPHLHLLVFMENSGRFLRPEVIDDVIMARFPTAAEDHDGSLAKIVEGTMIQGPCGDFDKGAICTENDATGRPRCHRKFPKPFREETTVPDDSYPLYYRPNTGTVCEKTLRGRTVAITNEWVVPYSPFLLKRYNAHINVEICNSVSAVKYIFKYVYKGGDRATVEFQAVNEVREYLDGRYLGPTEAVSRLLAFRFHDEFPFVQHLAVHLEGQHAVYYSDEVSRDPVHLQQRKETARSTLMGYFQFNRNAPANQLRCLYAEMPRLYTWNLSSREWRPRKNR